MVGAEKMGQVRGEQEKVLLRALLIEESTEREANSLRSLIAASLSPPVASLEFVQSSLRCIYMAENKYLFIYHFHFQFVLLYTPSSLQPDHILFSYYFAVAKAESSPCIISAVRTTIVYRIVHYDYCHNLQPDL